MDDISFEKCALDPKDKITVELLEKIHYELCMVNENLIRLISTRPSPS